MRAVELIWNRLLGRPYKLPYVDVGQGRPVVLLHGIASSKSTWRPLITKLDKARWRIIAPDLLGFGQAPAPNWNEYTVHEHARMVIATLQAAHIRGPVTIVGHSMGCLIAVHIATIKPKLVERLVLFEPPLFVNVPEYRLHLKRRERYFAIFEYIAAHPQLLFGDNGELRRIVAKVSGLSMHPETWIPFQRSLRNAIMQHGTYDELRHLNVLTDIIYGRFDFMVTRVQVEKMFADNPLVSMHIVNRMHGVSTRAAGYLARLLALGRSTAPV